MAAGIAALTELSKPGTYEKLESKGSALEQGLKESARKANVAVTFNRVGSMFCSYFTSQPVWNLADAMTSDRDKFARFFRGMLNHGVYLAPSQFEAGFISLAHADEQIDKTIAAASEALKGL